MHVNYIDRKGHTIVYSMDNAPNLATAFSKFELVLAFDQSSTCTGLTIGDIKGNELLFMAFEREKAQEKDYMEYKGSFKTIFNKVFKGCDINTLLYEETHSEGYVEVDKVLSTMRTVFTEIKQEYGYKYDAIAVPQQTWKSCFLLKGHKQQTKENVEYAARHYMPTLYAVQDVYDSLGIYFYYKTEIMPSKLGLIFKPYKGMKIEKRHNLTIRVLQCNSKNEIQFTEQEKKKIHKYGLKEFLYSNDKWIEENARMLTSHSNKVWVAEIDNTNKGMYVNAIWCNYDIIPKDDMKLFCIVSRDKKLDKAMLDK